MITFTETDVTLPVGAAVALLEFASKDATRTHLCGVGIDGAWLGATDGHAALMFRTEGEVPANYKRAIWPRVHVASKLAAARAAKEPCIRLEYTAALGTSHTVAEFPPLERVFPTGGVDARHPIGLNPSLLARLCKVAKACGVKGLRLCNALGSGDPIGFDTVGGDLEARVAIMPMRL